MLPIDIETLILPAARNKWTKMHLIQDDSELVKRVRAGDSQAFRAVYDKYHEKVYYFAVRYYHSSDDAENIVQDVFAKIWLERQKLNESLSLNNYIYTITKNHLFNINRKKIHEQKYRKYIIDHFSAGSSFENELHFKDYKEQIDKVIEKLPAQRKKVFIMGNIEGKSNKELAGLLNLSVRTIEVHKSLALKTIRKAIQKIIGK